MHISLNSNCTLIPPPPKSKEEHKNGSDECLPVYIHLGPNMIKINISKDCEM